MPTPPQPILGLERVGTSMSRSFGQSAPIAQASLARDIEEYSDSEAAESDSDSEDDYENGPLSSTSAPGATHSFVGSYRRPSFSAAGSRAALLPRASWREDRLSRQERQRALEEERSLLRDNDIIPAKHPRTGEDRRRSIFGIPGGNKQVPPDEAAGDPATETAALLPDPNLEYGGLGDPENISKRWEEAVTSGKIQTTWQREAKVISRYALPLMITFVLQYSLTVASVFTVGHIGVAELGAVSLASMTANITGYAIYQGLATSLDTLCAQAYGSGRKKLVGLQMQRMVWFLWAITIPIAVIWLLADEILSALVPEKEVAHLAGLYLRVVLAGAPGYAAFEAGKRFCQAQGLFSASLWVLIFCAPFNAFLNWLFVWHLAGDLLVLLSP
ncbi:Ethionine resistance-conferring protein 1 [Cyphellophora attinorum]|uniref:Ethionine resistance-conferring protein 1 n=1 Tax=Cyphellophora attinorum TaxID=1664694 RepID=A0A0N0NI74_9EURO|nr:Ethionine resistance-conferring protein 1 [Phialophora attinorum]KPI35511.1 Ethionine resistance-conferring protein 1 [Phialophora attinorum]